MAQTKSVKKQKSKSSFSPSALSWISSDLKYLAVNEQLASMFNLGLSSFKGQDIGFLKGKNNDKYLRFIKKVFASPQSQHKIKFSVKDADQQKHDFLLVARKYDEGKEAMIIGMDITDKNKDKLQYYLKYDKLSGISPKLAHLLSINETIKNFFQKYPLLNFKKGELIYRPGENFSQIAFVKSGYIRQYTITEEGEELTLSIFKPVFNFSLINAITETENKYYFEAITPVSLWRAPKKKVINFIKSDPEIMYEVMKDAFSSLQENISNIEVLLSGNAYQKVTATLVSLATNYGSATNGHVKINFKTSHQIIASLVGLTRETCSLQMSKLKKQGLITKQGRFLVINNLSKLKQELDLDYL